MLGEWRPRFGLMLVLLLIASTASGQSPAAPGAPGRWESDRLRNAIEQRYTVVPLEDGVVLVPRRATDDVKSIEVRGSTIALNGTVVTGAEVRQRLGSDADPILALSYLDPAARKALFESKPETPPAPAEQPERPAESQPPPEIYTTHSDTKVHIGGGVEVGEHEMVDGPVVAIGGPATIDGEVTQDVVAIAGNVRLGPKARVGGDVTTVGGVIDQDPGAVIRGRRNQISIGFRPFRLGRLWWIPGRGVWVNPFGPITSLMFSLFRMLLFGLLAFFVLLVARNPVTRIEQAVALEPWKAGLVGLLTQLLFIPVFVLTIVVLAVSIIGIPLLLFVPPLALLAFILALVLGFTGVAYRVGRWAEQRFGWTRQTAFTLLLVGLLAVWAVTIAGRLVSLVGWPIWFATASLLAVGFLIEYIAWTVGLGAAVMTRLGSRPGPSVPLSPPPVAPVPGAPQAGGAA